MTNRRDFLQIALSASALPMVAGVVTLPGEASAAPAVAALPVVPLYKVLVDDRFAESREFGQEAQRRGAVTHTFARGDLTDFWFKDLDLLWRHKPVAIAGLTQHGPLFVLEQLAADRGLQVAYRGEHLHGSDGRMTHRLQGPAASLQLAAQLGRDTDWSRSVAGIVTQCAHGCSPVTEATIIAPLGNRPPLADTLYSWVIAPRMRA